MTHSNAHSQLERWTARALEILMVAAIVVVSSLGMSAAQGAVIRPHHQVRAHLVVHVLHRRLDVRVPHRVLPRRRIPHQMVATDSNDPFVPPALMAAWTRVAICEEGGNWHVRGPRFSGGLGISNDNWVHFGGRQFAWNASTATPRQQVTVAMRIQRDPPDQDGCHSW
jgi:hypothetical protein